MGRDTGFSQYCFRKHPAVEVKGLYGCSAGGQHLPLKIPTQGVKAWQRHEQADGLRKDKESY